MTQRARATAARAAQFVATPGGPPPDGEHADRALYGLVQPIVGARTLLRDPQLLRAALLPALLLAGFCALVALIASGDEGLRACFKTFYKTFAILAPMPSLILGPFYARMAVRARAAFGFSPAAPCIEPLWRAARRWLAQTLVVALAIVPTTLPLHFIPVVGVWLLRAVAALWTLHWVVVEAFDGARVLHPGETLASVDAAALTLPSPWFVRVLKWLSVKTPILGGLLGWFAGRCDRWSRPWREEVEILEKHPSLAGGFALTTAALLATPVLNLLFRPIVVVAAVHVLGRLEAEAQASSTARTLPVSVSTENGFCKNAAP